MDKELIRFRNSLGKEVAYTKNQVADQLARYSQDTKPMSMSDYQYAQKEAKKHGFYRVED